MSSATAHTTRVDICVCTYRRPYLEETLRSLAALELPAWLTARVVVADNDTQPSARALVETVSAALPFEVRYVHCPASNISLARNASSSTRSAWYSAFCGCRDSR